MFSQKAKTYTSKSDLVVSYVEHVFCRMQIYVIAATLMLI